MTRPKSRPESTPITPTTIKLRGNELRYAKHYASIDGLSTHAWLRRLVVRELVRRIAESPAFVSV